MNKRTLKQLGGLCRVIDELFQIWVESHFQDEEVSQKLKLARKVKRNLEEKARGFLKSKVPYHEIAEFIISNSELSYQQLFEEVKTLALK